LGGAPGFAGPLGGAIDKHSHGDGNDKGSAARTGDSFGYAA
jgi:hypothetical protein